MQLSFYFSQNNDLLFVENSLRQSKIMQMERQFCSSFPFLNTKNIFSKLSKRLVNWHSIGNILNFYKINCENDNLSFEVQTLLSFCKFHSFDHGKINNS